MWRVNFDLRHGIWKETVCVIRGICSSNSVISYGHQKILPLGNTSKYDKVTRKPFLFYQNVDCTNYNYHFQTLLALTTIFVIHLCVHLWGASTAQAADETAGILHYRDAEDVSVQKRHGDLHNVTICNGKDYQVLANLSGVLGVLCLRNDCEHDTPPAGGFNINITLEIPNFTSKGDSTIPNGGIERLVEITEGPDPNITVTEGTETTFIGVIGVNTNTKINFFF